MAKAEDKTVLVVDDEPNVRDALRVALEDAGFRVVTAGDGVEALELIEANPPDFISLDLLMPRKSGPKVLFHLRRDKQLAKIPVLIVTAHAHDELGRGELENLFDQGVMSGPGAYLEKPVNPRKFVECVQRALGVEISATAAEKVDLRAKLQESLDAADPEALRRALAALKPDKK